MLALLRRALGGRAEGCPTRPRSTTTRWSSWRRAAGGDARTALAALELACETAAGERVTIERAEDALQRRAVLYDKGGDRHYDTISASEKSDCSNPATSAATISKTSGRGGAPCNQRRDSA